MNLPTMEWGNVRDWAIYRNYVSRAQTKRGDYMKEKVWALIFLSPSSD